MEPPQKKQRLDPPPPNVPSQSTLRDAYGNDLLSSFDGSGISNPGGNFHVAGNVLINSNATPQRAAHNRQVLLESLRFDQIDARHDSVKRAHAKTCHWFLDIDVYKKWESRDSSDVNNFLWIKGKPGAGKSTLMKFLNSQIHARTRQENKNEILIHFFFHGRGHDLERSTIGLYRSLLWQLLNKKPDLGHVLDELQLGYQWTIEALKSLIEEVIQELGDTPICCLIDALDECDQDQIRDMIEFLEALINAQSSLHVCFASRHYPNITVQSSREIILEKSKGHGEDISLYLSSALRITPNDLAVQIRSEMLDKADGVFMWVVLVVEILNKEFDSGRKYRLRERLKQLPGDLHLLFRDILTRDTNNQANLLLCIQWILFAKAPLTPRQLHLAILSGTEPDFLPHCHSEPMLEEDVQRYILDNSKGLAELTQYEVPRVQFIHESVRDFLLKHDGLGALFDDLGSNVCGESHEALKNCCLTYMTMGPLVGLEETSSGNAVEKFPFLDYANSGVLYHANEAVHYGISQNEFLKTFPRVQWARQQNVTERPKSLKSLYTADVSLLYILATAGVPDLIRAHSGRQSCFDIEHEYYGVPILAALASGHELTAQVMLELQAEQILGFDFADFCGRFQAVEHKLSRLFKADPRWRPYSSRPFMFRRDRTLIEQLIQYGNDRTALFFLETIEHGAQYKGADLCKLFILACECHRLGSACHLYQNCIDILAATDEEIPLQYPISFGFRKAIQLLVNRGAGVNAETKSGRTLLHYASKLKHHILTQVVIDHGAEISPVDNNGYTPLHDAAKNRNFVAVELLLDHGADASAADKSGRTPLHHAGKAGGPGGCMITKLLLERGADPSATDSTHMTPLHYASRSSYDIVQLLIDHGVNIQAMDNSGTTPLHEACRFTNIGTALLLVHHGADPSHKDLAGKTPLHQISAEFSGDNDFLIGQLLDHGADICALDNSRETPLHSACLRQDPGVVQKLLEHGADVSSTNRNGETPLHLACQGYMSRHRVEIIKRLVRRGANISTATDNGQTPLHQLISKELLSRHSERNLVLAAAEILVDSGANVSAPDEEGRTPMQLALSGGWTDIVNVFRKGVEKKIIGNPVGVFV